MITLVLFAQLATTPMTCNGTIFGQPGDKWAGGNALALKRKVNPTDTGIAHRTWPMGTTVMVYNIRTKKFAVGTVIDRGPYGALAQCPLVKDKLGSKTTKKAGVCWYVKKKRKDPGKWRGCADLTPALAKAIGHNGYEKVRVWRMDMPKKAVK